MQKEKAQSGILYGIGVGPGEPELLTHKAVQVIECCDTIVVPSESIEECNAFQTGAGHTEASACGMEFSHDQR